MRILTRVISVALSLPLLPAAHAAPPSSPRVEPFVFQPPTQIVRLKQFLKKRSQCDKATTDTNVPSDVCRIDVKVSVISNKCDVTVEGEVHTTHDRPKIEWVIKNAGGADDIRFADFGNFSSILPRDGTPFEPFVRASGGHTMSTAQKAKGGSYYYIFLQWTDNGGLTKYCEVIDPIINNDDPTP